MSGHVQVAGVGLGTNEELVVVLLHGAWGGPVGGWTRMFLMSVVAKGVLVHGVPACVPGTARRTQLLVVRMTITLVAWRAACRPSQHILF